MANVGDLKVLLTADDKASDKIAKSGSNIRGTLGTLGKSYAILGGVIAGTFAGSVTSFMKTGDELHKMALRTGMSVEALDRLGYVASLSGNSLKDVENMLRRQTITMNEARDGTMIGVEAFEKLGISLTDLEGLSSEEQFLKILSTLADMTNETEQVDAAMAVFGNRMGTSVIPMIAGGTGALKDMVTEATENSRMTQEQADQAALLTDQMFALKTQIQAVSINMASDLAPALSSIIIGLQKFMGIVKTVSEFMSINLPTAFVAVVIGINAVRTALLMMGGAMSAATGGMSMVIGALITAGVWFATTENSLQIVINKFKEFGNFLIEKIGVQVENFVNMFVRNINHMIDAINFVAGALGFKLIPRIPELKLEIMEIIPVYDKLTEVTNAQNDAIIAQGEGYEQAIESQHNATEMLEEMTEAQVKAIEVTTKQKKVVDDLNSSLGFGGMSLGGGGGFGGGGGSAGVSMGAMMAAFPSLHSGQAQSEYRAALAMMASRRVGAGDGPIDIDAEVAKHGAFSNIGGMSGTTHNITNVNAITSSHVTKILSDGETRGLGN
ncbi:MAG: hypothetical protein Unbinned657contig1001_45 [Prokaryotic dsDNA virus sp.]|nr:MAG: hypothetical protein Unbinned657contig1001_45 [Prokaryotic dsDNA virus sp.]|tara:strand:- start:804 stop:2468 length:1665 start_codon:yes stop_codon:yes gene_type:complete